MKILNYIEQHLKILGATLVAGSMLLLTAGCSEVDGGTVQNTVQLPEDSVLNFACEDEGIYLEPCVLDNPENPYAKVAVTEDNKFELNDAAPSAKARYYLWATALAKGAGIPGENQYYTALSLQQVYADSGSETTRDQAIKAYRSVLDNFFFAPTFFIARPGELPGGERLLNTGFGSPDATGGDVLCHTDWQCENDSYTTAVDGPNSAPVSHNDEDNQSIKQLGDSLTFQIVTALPDTNISYEASVWAMNWTGNGTTDPFTGSGFMELSFLDEGGNVLAAEYVYVDTVNDGTNVYLPPQDGAETSDWTRLSVSAVAPARTESVKILLKHQLVGGSGGSLRWDDASITPVASISIALNNIVGGNLVDPESAGLKPLYSDPAFALSAISEWGYVYDPTTKIMSIFR